ncbi:hypothetical protein ACQPYK_07025 [Streptosporangium sp. CA-135522]|uniref:hypothetical protein n=1 Tax=Streptosporangium sp. CA-135522 TaxID=3240072 RepID=UPI003D8F2EA4
MAGHERQADGRPLPHRALPLRPLYRKDLFDKNGWNADPKTAGEPYELGKEITDPKAKRWAFGSIHEMARPIFRVPQATDLGRKGVAYTYGFLGGRPLYVTGSIRTRSRPTRPCSATS